MDWKKFSPATCWPDCWCEAPRLGSIILEPVNSWTNLCFIFAGIYFFLSSRKSQSKTNLLSSYPIYPQTYGAALIFLGLGSFFYHASQTFIGQWFDVFGMYLVTVYFVVYNLCRLQAIKHDNFFSTYLFVCSCLGLIIIFFPDSRRWLFGLILFIIVILTYFMHREKKTKLDIKYFIFSFAAYLGGQIFWILDKLKIWCDPFALMNGHGLWHMLTGIAAINIFLYFKSEKST